VGERRHELSEEQWNAVAALLPPAKRRGRRPRSSRDMLNAMMWVLRTGAPWRDLPERYGPWETVYRRFREWAAEGVLDRVLQRLRLRLDAEGYIEGSTWFVDGSSVRAAVDAAGAAKKGGTKSPRIMRWDARAGGLEANSTW
jgi:transposase